LPRLPDGHFPLLLAERRLEVLAIPLQFGVARELPQQVHRDRQRLLEFLPCYQLLRPDAAFGAHLPGALRGLSLFHELARCQDQLLVAAQLAIVGELREQLFGLLQGVFEILFAHQLADLVAAPGADLARPQLRRFALPVALCYRLLPVSLQLGVAGKLHQQSFQLRHGRGALPLDQQLASLLAAFRACLPGPLLAGGPVALVPRRLIFLQVAFQVRVPRELLEQPLDDFRCVV
jgi:hypothetical protein